MHTLILILTIFIIPSAVVLYIMVKYLRILRIASIKATCVKKDIIRLHIFLRSKIHPGVKRPTGTSI